MNHRQAGDPRPKRRRDRDNPYRIYTTGAGDDRRYFLTFSDGSGAVQNVEIDQALFEAFDRFELEDISQMHKADRHHACAEQAEVLLDRMALLCQVGIEEIVVQRTEAEKLHQAIAKLPEKQRRRLMRYYFGELTYEQIAEQDGCTAMPVKRSIDAAIKNLKKYFK